MYVISPQYEVHCADLMEYQDVLARIQADPGFTTVATDQANLKIVCTVDTRLGG